MPTAQIQPGDRTDPFHDAAAAAAEPAVELLRDGPGGRVELVRLGEGEDADSFLRLSVDDAARAKLLRELLLELPESATGFRDLLVSEAPLAAAFDLAEEDLGSPVAAASSRRDGSKTAAGMPPPQIRAIDLIGGLAALASALAMCAEHTGWVWAEPDAALIGLIPWQAHRAAGHVRWRAIFSAFDLLAEGDEAEAARGLAKVFLTAFDPALQDAPRFAHADLAQLAGRLEQLAGEVASYAQLAESLSFPTRLRLHAATDVGMRRQHNEDAYALLTLEQASLAGARFTLAAVADGMGGHNSGEVASSLALDLLRTQLGQSALAPRTRWGGLVGKEGGRPSVAASEMRAGTPALPGHLAAIIPAIGRVLNERAALEPALAGMGTTLVGLAQLTPQSTAHDAPVPEAQGAVFWVGDSRAYLLSAGGLAPLSVDHSYVQSLLDSGQIEAGEAFSHPQKNIITRCLGGSGNDDRPEVAEFTPGPGELVLLCSDGLSDALRDEDIWRIASETDGNLETLSSALIDAANAAGGPDNITVVLVACEPEG